MKTKLVRFTLTCWAQVPANVKTKEMIGDLLVRADKEISLRMFKGKNGMVPMEFEIGDVKKTLVKNA